MRFPFNSQLQNNLPPYPYLYSYPASDEALSLMRQSPAPMPPPQPEPPQPPPQPPPQQYFPQYQSPPPHVVYYPVPVSGFTPPPYPYQYPYGAPPPYQMLGYYPQSPPPPVAMAASEESTGMSTPDMISLGIKAIALIALLFWIIQSQKDSAVKPKRRKASLLDSESSDDDSDLEDSEDDSSSFNISPTNQALIGVAALGLAYLLFRRKQ